MSELLVRLQNVGLMWMIGSTLLLGIGCLLLRFTASPVRRQRLGELSVAATLVWMILALIPLPRLFSFPVEHKDAMASGIVESDGSRPQSIPAPSPIDDPTFVDSNTPILMQVSEIADAAALKLSIPEAASEHEHDAIPELSEVVTSPDSVVDVAGPTSILPVSKASVPVTSYFGAAVFLTGTVLCLFWLAIGHSLLIRIRWQSTKPDAWLQNLFMELAEAGNVPRVRLLQSRTCRRPISWGAIWPVIVLPHSMCQIENAKQLRMVLLHELGHTNQGDGWGNLIFTLAFPFLYAQPLFWWLRSQVRLASELVADDFASTLR